MKITNYHVNAFSAGSLSGNPAAVCVLQEWLKDETLLAIAQKNALPVSAFLVENKQKFSLRMFSPDEELKICGHGTLAASYVILNYLTPTSKVINIETQNGVIEVKNEQGWIKFAFSIPDFTSLKTTDLLIQALGLKPLEFYGIAQERCMAILENEELIKNFLPDFSLLKKLPYRGIVITAPGKDCDFVSRTFYPQARFTEDAVTGASHRMLVPYWAKRFNKCHLMAKQLSARGGILKCELADDKVYLSGHANLDKII